MIESSKSFLTLLLPHRKHTFPTNIVLLTFSMKFLVAIQLAAIFALVAGKAFVSSLPSLRHLTTDCRSSSWRSQTPCGHRTPQETGQSASLRSSTLLTDRTSHRLPPARGTSSLAVVPPPLQSTKPAVRPSAMLSKSVKRRPPRWSLLLPRARLHHISARSRMYALCPS